MTLAAVSMSTDFAYAPTNDDQTLAVFIGFILFHGQNTEQNIQLRKDIIRYSISSNRSLHS